ncbi:unnamed protein product [Caenorhabditis angaria]|uniref:Carboxylesterase type B domain-containing protein n=1 Tax=Caenorhabditis angaria TaxID=860376 RepID=A0A9P1J2D6_9PELO|nr:unnamed protein product [Caenorhabditis angaria]
MRWLITPFLLWWNTHYFISCERRITPFEVTVKSGAIRGERITQNGQDFTAFKGVPFAMPPVGYLRFQRPQEPAKWRGVMNATQYSPMCMQNLNQRDISEPERYVHHVSEDCLYINVFSPAPYNNSEKVPVIVFIHGGRFQTGSGSDIPQQAIFDNFVSRKASLLVFVTFNYRLGPLGFAVTENESTQPGNVGLWDQVTALRWVKDNIETFKGDSDKITLMGHGSGAASASLLALSPTIQNEHLFHGVILMSGSALQPGIVRNTSANATSQWNNRFGCKAFNNTLLLDCARKHSKEEIFENNRIRYDDYEDFTPTIDGENGLIPKSPAELADQKRKSRIPHVPMIIGTTRDESSLRIFHMNEKQLNFSTLSLEDGVRLVNNLTQGYEQFQNHKLIAKGCQAEYVNKQVDPSNNSSVLMESILKMYSHFWYDAPASRLAASCVQHQPNIYLYSFDHISENLNGINRAFHGVDKFHIFNISPRFLDHRKDMNWQIDKRVVEIFAGLVTNFAYTQTPTRDNDEFNFNWTSTTMHELNYLSITDSPTMKVGFRWQGHVFWNWYAPALDTVDVATIHRLAELDGSIGNWQMATAMLSFCSLFFFAILVGLACYCTRKESDEDEL